MNLIEITHPAGALDDAARTEVAQQIITGILGVEEIPAETLRRARRMMHVLFHEARGWTTGDGILPEQAPPPFIVTITVPEAWREEMSRHGIGVVRAALRRLDNRRGISREGGDVWINVIGVADGSIGLNGKVTTAAGVVNYMTEEYRATPRVPVEVPDGVVIDPICGMQVRLGPRAITLDHDGTTVGFCATGCRDAYAENEGLVPDKP
jgi:YHS domain-containing protein